jgi:guanylate kinase
VGKSTVVRRVRQLCPQLWLSVSATTRLPRPGEVDGIDYRFLSRVQFDAMIAGADLLEHAEFTGNLYGTPRGPVLARLAGGTPVLLEIELQGARQVRLAMPEARLVFLEPPSWEVLVSRLVGRGTEPPDIIERRLEQARVELAAKPEFDDTVVNSSVDDAARALVALLGLPGV